MNTVICGVNGGANKRQVIGGVQFHYLMSQSMGEVVAKVGVGTDGTLWMQPLELGIRPEMLGEVTKELTELGRPGVMLDVDDGRLYVSVQAYADIQDSAEERSRMLDWADRWVDQLHPTNYRK
jgi:hypothetical protein